MIHMMQSIIVQLFIPVIKVTHDILHPVIDIALLGNIIQRMLNYIPNEIHPALVNLETLASRLKVLAEPKRLLIINMLMEGVQCNCELGDALQMAPNLISHHLSKLREVGLVNVERDPLDSRWVYYSVNRAALDELTTAFGAFFDPARIQPRRLTCGPQALVSALNMTASEK
jgi:ArsR family transcriptional regulator